MRDINTLWGDETDPEASKWFTHEDWLATQAMSYSQWQIKDWLRTPEGRATLKPEDQPGVIGGTYNNIIQSIRGDLERIGRKDFATDLGASATDFGGADYMAALQTQGVDPYTTRQEVLAWLTDNPEFLAYGNRPKEFRPEYDKDKPETYGLYERIKGEYHNRDINTFWGDWSKDPDAGQFFTHDDLLATRAMGFTELEISDWIDTNQGTLRDADKPGVVGGVYESIDRGIARNRTSISRDQFLRERVTPTIGESDLKIKTAAPLIHKAARGVERAKRTRPQYKQTTDLARSSLNIGT